MPSPHARPVSRPSRPAWRWLLGAALLLGTAQLALAGGNATVAVGATVLSKNNCKFRTAGSPSLAFGNIDPSGSANATASATLTIRCAGASPTVAYALNHDSGQHETGVNLNRMKHAMLNMYLPYALTLAPSSGTVGKNVDQAITLSATITPANFQNAVAGAYADTVVITLAP